MESMKSSGNSELDQTEINRTGGLCVVKREPEECTKKNRTENNKTDDHQHDEKSSIAGQCFKGQVKIDENYLLNKFKNDVDSIQESTKLSNKETFTCLDCGKKMSSRIALKRHTNCVHGNKLRKHACDWPNCAKAFYYKSDLQKHNDFHTRNSKMKTHSCNICERKFHFIRDVEKHMIASHYTDPVKCDICGQIYKSAKLLKEHVKHMHGEDQNKTCEICGVNVKRIRLHMKTHGDKFPCSLCSKVFLSIKAMQTHRTTHTIKNFTCQNCKSQFALHWQFDKHVESNLCVVDEFTCEICNEVLKITKNEYNEHIYYHKESKKIRGTCEICQKSFRTVSILEKHMTTHTMQKEFKCKDCGRCYTSEQSLERHMRNHNGIRPYKCTTCGATFTQDVILKNHVMLHTGILPFQCEICGRRFRSKYFMMIHAKCHEKQI